MKKIAIVFLALVGLIYMADAARAQNNPPQYGAFRVSNNTDKPIAYQVQWYVNGVAQGWKTYTVQPGTYDSHYCGWSPGQSFPYAEWTYFDITKGAWTKVGKPAACMTTDPKEGGFKNTFIYVNDGRDLFVTWT